MNNKSDLMTKNFVPFCFFLLSSGERNDKHLRTEFTLSKGENEPLSSAARKFSLKFLYKKDFYGATRILISLMKMGLEVNGSRKVLPIFFHRHKIA